MHPRRRSCRKPVEVFVVLVAAMIVLASAACGSSNTATTEGTAAASAASSATSASSTENVTPADTSDTKKVFKQDDTTIKVVSGEKFAIRLPENPSVGDRWIMTSEPDASFVKLDGDSFKSDDPNPMPGAGGQHEFKFKARNPGTTTVTLSNCYRCGTNSSVSPENSALAKTITYTITVR